MKVLWVTRRLPAPPFYGGDALYSGGLIGAVAATSGITAVTVLCRGNEMDASSEDQLEWRIVRDNERPRVLSLLSRLPALAYTTSTHAMRGAVDEVLRLKACDVVVVDGLATAPIADAVPHRVPIAYVAHNHERTTRRAVARAARGWQSLVLRLDARKAARLEMRTIARASLVTAISDADRALFRREARPGTEVITVPPGYDGETRTAREIGPQTPRRVVILGSFRWVAKQQNLRTVLDSIAPELSRQGIEVEVVGDIAPDLTRDLLRDHPAVVFRGAVDDIGPYLSDSRIGLVTEPVGGGFKLKVLDYIFHRVPIISLLGGTTGTPLAAGVSMGEVSAIGELVGAVAELIDDLDRLNRLQRAAFESSTGLFDWPDRGSLLAHALASIVERHRTPRHEELST